MVKELSLNFGKSKARRDVHWRHITAVGVPLVVVASLAIGVQCAIYVDTEHTFVGKANGGGTGVCNNFNPNGNNNGHRGAGRNGKGWHDNNSNNNNYQHKGMKEKFEDSKGNSYNYCKR